MKQVAARLALILSIMIVLITVFWLLSDNTFTVPEKTNKVHLIFTGLSRGHIHSQVAKFKPYRGKTMGGAASICTAVKQLRNALTNDFVCLFSIGSDLSGTADANLSSGAAMINVMNHLGYSGMLLGNMEFTYGQKRLKELANIANFPFISSNITNSLTSLEPDFLIPSLVIEPEEGFKIAFLGLTPPDTPSLTPEANVKNLNFEKPQTALKEKIEKLRSEKVDLIVLLTSYAYERISINEWRQIIAVKPDLCIMVDSSIEPPPAVLRDGIVVKTISAYNRTMELDLLSIEFSGKNKEIIDFASNRIAIDNNEFLPDPEMLKIVENETKLAKEAEKQEIAVFAADYQRNYSTECPIGNMITDAMLAFVDADIAFHNSGAIRRNISSGTFSLANLYDVLPFDNSMVSMDISGEELKNIIYQSATLERGVLQLSGAQYTFKWNNTNDVELHEILIKGEPLDENATYRVVTNDFLAGGGDLYLGFLKATEEKIEMSQRDAVMKYIQKKSAEAPIELGLFGRIQRLDDNLDN